MIRKVVIPRKDIEEYHYFDTLASARAHLRWAKCHSNLPYEIVRCYRSYWKDSVAFLGYVVVQSCFVPSKDFDIL